MVMSGTERLLAVDSVKVFPQTNHPTLFWRFRLITVPGHNPLKTGTLHFILAEVAQIRSVTIGSLAEML